MEKKKINHLLVGGIISGFLILLTVLLLVFDQFENNLYSWLGYGLMIAILIYFVNAYGKQHDHNVSFGSLFSFGFKATAFSTIIILAFQVVLNLSFPEYKERIMEIAIQKMSQDPRATDESVEMGISFLNKTFWPFLIAGTIFTNLIVGALGSLIGAGVTKKNPVTPFT